MFFILIKGSLMNQFGFDSLDIDLVSILIGCLLSAGENVLGAVFALGLGLLTDVFSAGWPGLSAFLYMVVFLAIQLGSKFFDLHSSRGLLILVFLAVSVKGLLLMGVLMMVTPRVAFSPNALSALAVSALSTALLAPPVFYAVSTLSGSFTKEAESAG